MTEYNDELNIDLYSVDDPIYSYSRLTKLEIDSLFPTEYKDFTIEDYKTLNENLILYKNGNAEAAQYIISVFHRFVKKYTDFICLGYYGDKTERELTKYKKPHDKSLSRFISLFIPKSEREKTTTNSERDLLFAETCVKIQKIFSKYEYWDIYNELTCTLLNMANKYKITKEGDKYHKENGTFHMYVSKCFHYDAYNSLTKIIGDPLAHYDIYSIEDELRFEEYTSGTEIIKDPESILSTISRADMKIILKDTDTDKLIEKMIERTDRNDRLKKSNNLILRETEGVDPYDVESLNFNWTNGNTCSDTFKCLTSYERELMVMSFIQNKKDTEIAKIYGCHRITIVKHRKMAIQKIKTYIAESGGKLNDYY